jgi:hypothetical protein
LSSMRYMYVAMTAPFQRPVDRPSNDFATMLRPTLWFNRPAVQDTGRSCNATPRLALPPHSVRIRCKQGSTLTHPHCSARQGQGEATISSSIAAAARPRAPNQGLKLGDRMRTRGGSTGVRGSAAPPCSEPMPRRPAPSEAVHSTRNAPAAHITPSRTRSF